MRPIKPEERQLILDRFPEDRHTEISNNIEEYQELNATRFRRDPESVKITPLNAAAPAALRNDNLMEVGLPEPSVSPSRLRELRQKLFNV